MRRPIHTPILFEHPFQPGHIPPVSIAKEVMMQRLHQLQSILTVGEAHEAGAAGGIGQKETFEIPIVTPMPTSRAETILQSANTKHPGDVIIG